MGKRTWRNHYAELKAKFKMGNASKEDLEWLERYRDQEKLIELMDETVKEIDERLERLES